MANTVIDTYKTYNALWDQEMYFARAETLTSPNLSYLGNGCSLYPFVLSWATVSKLDRVDTTSLNILSGNARSINTKYDIKYDIQARAKDNSWALAVIAWKTYDGYVRFGVAFYGLRGHPTSWYITWLYQLSNVHDYLDMPNTFEIGCHIYVNGKVRGWIWDPKKTYDPGVQFKFYPNNGNASGMQVWMVEDYFTDAEFVTTAPMPVPPPPKPPVPDPFNPGGGNKPDGGGGDFDDTSDDVAVPNTPNIGAYQSGLITLYNPSTSDLSSIASFLWSDLFDISTWKKVFSDPMQAILGLSIVPVNVPSAGSKELVVGNVKTGISLPVASGQYVTVDCGSINVKEYWGAYLDYAPYTKLEIYLPYIGTHSLNIDDVMNKTIGVTYHVDVLSGSCVAFIKCGNSVLYSYSGSCAVQIPVTASNYNNMLSSVVSTASAFGAMALTGGASAPLTAGAVASAAVNAVQKPTTERSGAIGGSSGLMGIQYPYLILTRPEQALPKQQNKFTGYPAVMTYQMGELEGYTEVEHVHLNGMTCTEAELNEIEDLLKGGVIF